MANKASELRLALNVLQLALTAAASARPRPVPAACATCLYRREDMRDGGWCYMFREMPEHRCAQFKAE